MTPMTLRLKTTRIRLNIMIVFPGMGVFIIKMGQSGERFILIMGIHVLASCHHYIETGVHSETCP